MYIVIEFDTNFSEEEINKLQDELMEFLSEDFDVINTQEKKRFLIMKTEESEV